MAIDFPSTGLVAGTTTYTVGNKTWTWNGTAWDSNTVVLSGTSPINYSNGVISLTASAVTSLSNLSTVGTITSGIWNGTAIGIPYGGTGVTARTKGGIVVGTGTNTTTELAVGTDAYVLTADSTQASGVKWAASSGGVKYTYSSTPPSSPTAGDIWVDSGDGTEYTYVADGDSNQWVELSNAGLPGPATTGATGATGATGSSGIISVSSPILNTGTSTSAVLSLNSAIVPYLNTANTFTVSPQQININSASNNGLIIKAASSQTADIQQWQDSGSNALAKIAYDGSASFANGISAGKNYLINGAFDFWQRGTSFGTLGVYTADRWIGFGAGTVTYSQETSLVPTGFKYAFKFLTGSTGAYGELYQAIENQIASSLFGKTITLSGYVLANASYLGNAVLGIQTNTTAETISGGTWTEPAVTSITPSTSTWQRFSVTYTVPATGLTGIRVRLGNTVTQVSGGALYWAGIQLEVGSTPTIFTRAGGTLQAELAACQRYYFRSTPGNGAGQYGTGLTSTTTTAYCYINLPVPMRVIPTAVESNSLQVIDRVAATAYAASGIALSDGISTNFIELSMTIATATAGRFVALRNATSAGYLGFSAEL